MYEYIINPNNKKLYLVYSKKGKNILKMYLKLFIAGSNPPTGDPGLAGLNEGPDEPPNLSEDPDEPPYEPPSEPPREPLSKQDTAQNNKKAASTHTEEINNINNREPRHLLPDGQQPPRHIQRHKLRPPARPRRGDPIWNKWNQLRRQAELERLKPDFDNFAEDLSESDNDLNM